MKYAFLLSLLITTSCMAQTTYKTVGKVERYDDALDKIVSKDAIAEVIADGFLWSEGALWIEKHKMLLFSDVRRNTIFKWTESKGKEVYLTPSGYTGSVPRGGEMGSNGLTLDNKGNLVMCQHGDRRMARMDAPLDKPEARFITLADKINGKRFSSPNDATFNSKGELFFTDPPYGLPAQSDRDSSKETSWNGVYKVKKNGEVILLVDSLTRPNGIAFFPGGKKILIANSDPQKPNWYIYDVDGDKLKNGRIFYSAAGVRGPGLPDG
ncbi:MAG: SMP-30/gluconolactonase/LRE family protein, partial [Flavisolibacter sp.]|nr:SMP-30/gluconolactonase/LRE family protein [Flavisolibacter sp.]